MSLKVIRADFGGSAESIAIDLESLAVQVRAGECGNLRRAVLVLEDVDGRMAFEVLGSSISTAELAGVLFMVMQDVVSKDRDG